MISEVRLAQIVAVITELSEEKKADFYKFLLDLKKRYELVVDENDIARLRELITEVQRGLGNKVDKVNGKGLSSNDFTNELRTKLVNITGNVQANWNTSEQTDPSYIANKPDLSNYVQKDGSKVLSDNNFSDSDKQKLDGLSTQIQADWNQDDNTKKDFIKNKPSVYTQQQIDQMLQNVGGGGTPVDTSSFEVKTNKVTSISDQSTNDQYPSAACVYTIVGNIEATLNAILGV